MADQPTPDGLLPAEPHAAVEQAMARIELATDPLLSTLADINRLPTTTEDPA